MLNERSEKNLIGVNEKLVKIARKASILSEIPFVITEGLRTKERQEQLVKSGASRTMNSKHIIGRAIDVAPLVNGQLRWDWPLFYKLADAFKKAAKELDIQIVWGGDWKTFKDGPHFELADSE